MFRGRYEHTIDAKGRLSIPSKFRDILSQDGDLRIVVTAYDGCLIAYPYEEWRILEEKLSSHSEFNRDTRALLRFFYSSAVDCTIDKLGRILVPQTLRDYAKFDKDIVVIGMLKHLEIWSREEWERAEEKVSQDDIGDALGRLNL